MIGLSKCGIRLRWFHSKRLAGAIIRQTISDDSGYKPHSRHIASTSADVVPSIEVDRKSSSSITSSAVINNNIRQAKQQQQQQQQTRKWLPSSSSSFKNVNNESNSASTIRYRIAANGRRMPSQGNSEEFALMQKHRETLDANELNSIFDVVESIEWRRTVSQAMLNRMLELLASPKLSVANELNDRQIAILLSATGATCSSLNPNKRYKYTERILQILTNKDIKLGLLARNALLNVQLENGIEVNVVEILKEFKEANIEPSSETFGALSKAYALKGDILGIVEIINHLKEVGIQTSEQIIEWMTYALALSDRNEQALSLIKSFSSNESFSEAKLRIAYAKAKAIKGDVESIAKIFEGVTERLKIKSRQNSTSILDIVFILLEQGHWKNDEDYLAKCSNFVPFDEDGKLLDICDFVSVSGRLRQYRDPKEGNIEAAIQLYKLLPEKYARFQRDYFRSYLFDSLQRTANIDETIELGVQFEKAGILRNPRRILIDYALQNNRGRFYELYEKFLKSDEMKRLGRRAHLAHPYIVHLLNQLAKTSSSEKKAEIFARIAKTLFKWEPPQMRLLNEWFLEPLTKELHLLAKVMENIGKDERIIANVATTLIGDLLSKNMFSNVNEMLDGPLKGATLNITYLSGILRQIFLRSSSDDHLKIASRILASAFPDDNERYVSPQQAIKLIESTLLSKTLNEERMKSLMRIWSENGRIALPSQDLENLQKSLNDAGQSTKARLIVSIKRKPKTLARWKQTEDVNLLETEAKKIASSNNAKKYLILQTLYAVIAEKRFAEKVLNVASVTWLLEHYNTLPDTVKEGFFFEFNAKLKRTMQEAILTRNLDAAKRLWKIGGKKLPTLMKIAYASLLHHCTKRTDEAKQILNDLYSNAETFDINTLSNSQLLIEDDAKECKAFLEMIAVAFKMNTETKRRLLSGLRLREFDKLIESGHLEEAFAFAKDIGAETGRAFGQLQLMRAALKSGDMQLLTNVINMVQHKHDKNAALIDFGIALLEDGRVEHATQIFGTSGLHLSSAKLEYFIERETRAARADVLFNLFKCLSDGDKASTVDVEQLLIKLITLYGAEQNSDGIANVENEIKRSSFPVSEQLKKCIELNLKKVSQSPATANESQQSSSR